MIRSEIWRWAISLLGWCFVSAGVLSLGWYFSPETDPDVAPDPVEKSILSRPENDVTNLSAAEKACPWGTPVDGIACRLIIQPRYVVGQAITAVIELKNLSNKKRYLVRYLEPDLVEYTSISVSGPRGKLGPTHSGVPDFGEHSFWSIDAGEVKRFEVYDLRRLFGDLDPIRFSDLATGRYSLQLRFRSPKIPARFEGPLRRPKDAPPEWLAGQWAHEVVSAPVAFELVPLSKNDLVVHEWGVLSLFNDPKYANSGRKQEWGNLPNFFYRQFPRERLRWDPAGWNKPIVYFYAKRTPLELRVNATFTDGVPVIWWPAVIDPVDEGRSPDSRRVNQPRPYRSLTWNLWLGRCIPDPKRETGRYYDSKASAWTNVKDFALPPDCWVRQARLPAASPLTVVGSSTEIPRMLMPGMLDRQETERFLFYDGLVPTPDYLRCEKIDAMSVTLRNRANFDIRQPFVIDRRTPGKIAFACLDRKEKAFAAGTTLRMPLRKVAKESWPQDGIQQVKQALLDAGLFEAEADALLKIWREGLLEAEGLTVFHILPQDEYDRMLPLTIVPKPEGKPVRVGIALHPHMEIEPALVARIDALLHDLDDPAFAKRAATSKALVEMGPFAATVLRGELSQNPSLEMRHRIEEIVKQIDAADVQSLSPPPADKKK